MQKSLKEVCTEGDTEHFSGPTFSSQTPGYLLVVNAKKYKRQKKTGRDIGLSSEMKKSSVAGS